MASHLTAAERAQLDRFLDDGRLEVVKTLAGLSEEQARRRLVPSLTTPLGLVKHLTFVERIWFQVVLLGRTRAELGLPEEVDPTFVPDPGDTVASVIADYEQVCTESRLIAADFDLDHEAVHRRFGTLNLRWIYLHLLREINRHAGHADILREQLLASDGEPVETP
ncbi:DinB family protein [Nocardioides marmoriginsengisoli]|uniref:DinB family protein n=1 Tax=Nocardioides marmoriginsengisoli TaxID=661483 RepID=A0A3N0CP20_9ACTN|nr:DinB family protein [Nocardioides marmoriginsengisoli]RNL65212.1 DinB family protein [Nocardioides marmoriginsengisoli]